MSEKTKLRHIGHCVVCECIVLSNQPHTLVRADDNLPGEGNALHDICREIWNAAQPTTQP